MARRWGLGAGFVIPFAAVAPRMDSRAALVAVALAFAAAVASAVAAAVVASAVVAVASAAVVQGRLALLVACSNVPRSCRRIGRQP